MKNNSSRTKKSNKSPYWPEDTEYTVEFSFIEYKPVHKGEYEVTSKPDDATTRFGRYFWNGKIFVEKINGKNKPVKNVISWRGLNWDTTNWDKCPQTKSVGAWPFADIENQPCEKNND